MDDYFALLKDVLTDNQLINSPGRIYNVDERGIALDGHAPKVVAKQGQDTEPEEIKVKSL